MRNRLCLSSGEEPGENFRGSMRLDWTKLAKEVGANDQVQGEVWVTHWGWVPLLNTVLQSHLCEIKPCAFVLNNVFTFIQQLKKQHISFVSFLKRFQFPLKFGMLSQLPPVCIRNFTLPKGIIGMITHYIQSSAFEDIFCNYHRELNLGFEGVWYLAEHTQSDLSKQNSHELSLSFVYMFGWPRYISTWPWLGHLSSTKKSMHVDFKHKAFHFQKEGSNDCAWIRKDGYNCLKACLSWQKHFPYCWFWTMHMEQIITVVFVH